MTKITMGITIRAWKRDTVILSLFSSRSLFSGTIWISVDCREEGRVGDEVLWVGLKEGEVEGAVGGKEGESEGCKEGEMEGVEVGKSEGE